jgi:hypothetical protein
VFRVTQNLNMYQTELKKTDLRVFVVVYILFFLVTNVPLHVPGLVIGITKWNTCNGMNELNIWMIVFAAVQFGSGLITFGLTFVSFKLSKNFLPLIFAMLLNGMFSLSWFIYGGVLLFGNVGSACQNSHNNAGESVWQVGMVVWALCLLWGCGQNCIRPIAASKRFRAQEKSNNTNNKKTKKKHLSH